MAVLGVGANGSCIGADLTRAGYDVTLIDQWPAHVETMKAKGLRVKLIRTGEELKVPVRAAHLCELASLNQAFDLVFLVAKLYDTAWMVRLIEPYLNSEGVVVTAVNGLCDEWVTSIIGPGRDVPCAVELSSQIFEPGLVKRNTGSDSARFVIGELNNKVTPRIEEIAKILNAAGATEVTTNIWGAKWSKLISSTAGLAIMSVLGISGINLLKEPYLELSIKLGTETARVAKALGYELEPVFSIPKEEFRRGTLEDQVGMVLSTIMKDLGKQGTDELRERLSKSDNQVAKEGTKWFLDAPTQDLLKGRLTETEWLNGFIARKGRQVNVPTPLNEALNNMMREIEAGKRKMLDPDNFKGLQSLL